jgi:hypothetical protein
MLHARCSTRSCVSWVIDTATRRLMPAGISCRA